MTPEAARRLLRAALGLNALVAAILLVALGASLANPTPHTVETWDVRLHGAVAGLVAVAPTLLALAGAIKRVEADASARGLASLTVLSLFAIPIVGIQALLLLGAGGTCGPLRGLVAATPCIHPVWLVAPALAASALGVGAVLAVARGLRA